MSSTSTSTSGYGQPKSKAQGWDPKKEVLWTLETDVDGMKELVAVRAQVFREKRIFDDPDLRKRCEKAIQAVVRETTVERPLFQRYEEFCQAVNVPIFPITTSTIALFAFAKCSSVGGDPRTTVSALKGFETTTRNVWDEVEGIERVRECKGVEEALMGFLLERRNFRVTSAGRLRVANVSILADNHEESDLDELTASDDSDDDDHGQISSCRRSVSPDDRDDSDDDESPDSGEESDLSFTSLPASTTSHRRQLPRKSAVGVPQFAIPDLPKPGVRFPNIESVVVECCVATIPVYGYCVQSNVTSMPSGQKRAFIYCGRANRVFRETADGCCGWKLRILVEETGEVSVSSEGSLFLHNHPPHPNILSDPAWRPPNIQRVSVRARLGIPASQLKGKNKKSESISSAAYAASPLDSSASEPRSKKSKLDHLSTISAVNGSSRDNRSFSSSTASSSNSTASSSMSPPTASYSSSSPRHVSNPSSTLAPSTSSRLLAPASTSFEPQLAAFLSALDPRLAPLAPHLFASGLTSFDLLVKFCAFDKFTMRTFLTDLASEEAEVEAMTAMLSGKLKLK